jgi:hypothetical protein
MTQRSEPDRPGDTRPYRPVTDDYVVDALQGLESWGPPATASMGTSP